MANILKTGQTFNPSISAHYGVDMTGTTYYGVIDAIDFNKNEKRCSFSMDVYGSKELRQSTDEANRPLIVDRITFNFMGDEFDASIGNTGLTVPQAYTLSLLDTRLTDWESDEG